SHEELLTEVRALRSHIHALTCTVQSLYAELWASNAHCTISKRKCDETQERFNNANKKQRRTGKVKDGPRYITHPQLQQVFEEEDRKRMEREQEEIRKQQEKDAEATAREVRLSERAACEVFQKPLSTYNPRSCIKEDLQILARALKLPDSGTKEEIFLRIKAHLDANASLSQDTRFLGLFAAS
ncbi:hypothetical protein BDQ17DRAFT_1169776, partial [Cyathus striatus]